MNLANIVRLVILAAIWGGSYAFMRLVAPVFGGMGTMWTRIAIGGVFLLAFCALIRADLAFARWWRQYLVVGIFNAALPFALIAWAMARLPAGYGAILNATAPFFTVAFAAFWLGERITLARLLGMALGVAGIGLIVNLGPVELNRETLLAIGACIGATTCYGFINVYTKRYLEGAPGFGIASGTLVLPALLLAPFGIAALPTALPEPKVLAAVVALGVLCSAIAYVLYFRLIRDIGPTRAVSVTFLVPVFGVIWGAWFYGEAITPGMLAGGALVLVGVALVLGLFPIGASQKP